MVFGASLGPPQGKVCLPPNTLEAACGRVETTVRSDISAGTWKKVSLLGRCLNKMQVNNIVLVGGGIDRTTLGRSSLLSAVAGYSLSDRGFLERLNHRSRTHKGQPGAVWGHVGGDRVLLQESKAEPSRCAQGVHRKVEAEGRRQQLLAEHAKHDRPRRKVTSRKLLEALESKVSDAAR